MSPPPRPDEGAQQSEGGGIARILAESVGGMLRLPRFDWRGRLLIAVLIAVAWASTSIYEVQPDERGVVLRLGAPVQTVPPGLHVHLPYPIDTVRFSKVKPPANSALPRPAAAGRTP
jgi:membrane protease subunit HflK